MIGSGGFMRIFLSGLAAVASLSSAAMASGAEVAAPFVASRDSATFDRSLECLSQAIYFEARNQSDDGQRAVAQVVLNRVRHPAYPNSVCGVVYQGSQRSTGCQFTFTCDGSMNAGVRPDAWQRARRIAEAALRGSVYRPVGLATNYHTTAIHPYWAPSLVPQAIVGAHIFYRRPGSGSVEAFSQTPADDEPDIGSGQLHFAVSRSFSRQLRARFAPAPQVEIPVLERPVLFRAAGQRQSASSAAIRASAARQTASSETSATQVRPAVMRSGPRVSIQGGVRVFRGS
jgi:hypothetical protein